MSVKLKDNKALRSLSKSYSFLYGNFIDASFLYSKSESEIEVDVKLTYVTKENIEAFAETMLLFERLLENKHLRHTLLNNDKIESGDWVYSPIDNKIFTYSEVNLNDNAFIDEDPIPAEISVSTYSKKVIVKHESQDDCMFDSLLEAIDYCREHFELFEIYKDGNKIDLTF